jgi:uncharacterized protein
VLEDAKPNVFPTTCAHVLGIEPRLQVPGMTEFALPGGGVLGLMPIEGVRKLLGATLPDPDLARGIPRAELYLLSPDPSAWAMSRS